MSTIVRHAVGVTLEHQPQTSEDWVVSCGKALVIVWEMPRDFLCSQKQELGK